MLAVTLYDIYMASMILGAGYVVVSAVLGNFHFSASSDAGTGDVGGGTGGDIGHGGLDAGAGDRDAGGGDIGHDMAHDTGHVVDATDERRRAFSAFSPTIISSFMAGTGVVGLVLHKGYEWDDRVSLLPAIGGGLVLAYVLMAVYNKLAAAASGSSHATVRELIGMKAEVTTPIGADSPGEVAYVLKGSRFSRSARSANGQAIGRGEKVTIEARFRDSTTRTP